MLTVLTIIAWIVIFIVLASAAYLFLVAFFTLLVAPFLSWCEAKNLKRRQHKLDDQIFKNAERGRRDFDIPS